MNTKRSQITAGISLAVSLFALYAALKGVLDENIYREVFLAGALPEPLIGVSIAQDIVTIPIAMIMVFLSISYLNKPNPKSFITIIGLSTYTFYAYGLYTIQGQYTDIYILYLGIFSLSLHVIVLGLLSFSLEEARLYVLSPVHRMSAGLFMGVILWLLLPVWLFMITPDINANVPGNTYGVYVLDLGIVFPALAIILVNLFRKKPYGSILAGVALIKIFTVCLSWAFGEWFGAYYNGQPLNITMTAISSSLTLLGLVILIVYMRGLRKAEEENELV